MASGSSPTEPGTGDESNFAVEKLAEYQELARFNTSLTKTQFGTMPVSQARENTEAVAREILPFFKDDEPSTKASVALAQADLVAIQLHSALSPFRHGARPYLGLTQPMMSAYFFSGKSQRQLVAQFSAG